MILLPFVVFILGLLVGSFLNVVIVRLNTGRTFVRGRSICMGCNRTLQWYELIPVFSFLTLRGKCRTCRIHISFQYPVVELITALLFVILFTKILLPIGFSGIGWISYLYAVTIASLLIVITVYDFRHKIIPDSAVYLFILLALVGSLYKEVTIPGFDFFSVLIAGVFVALPFFLLWYFSKGRVMGFGDVKLALGAGWLLGLSGGFAAVLLSFWIGGLFGLFLIALTKQYSMKSQVPFAPFLITGIGIVGIWGITLSTIFPLLP